MACRFSIAQPEALPSQPVVVLPPTESEFFPESVRVGDADVNYANIEFTADMQYMVWFEMTDQRGNGVVWHCGVDARTGSLIPADGKGFRAFESTIYGRANPGLDVNGAYYVGMDQSGTLYLVRPTSPTSGEMLELPTPPDPLRRAIYPTILPGQEGGYVFWIKDEVESGATNPKNDWVELQYISLENPQRVQVVERQSRPTRRGFAPMDSAFARWMKGKPALTYGFKDENGVIQVRMLDLNQPNPAPQAVTNDPGDKVDPYSWFYNGEEILLPGIDGQAITRVYTRSSGDLWFHAVDTIIPTDSHLKKPALAQSNEPIVFQERAFTTYQVNEGGSSFWNVTFERPGEIWLSTLFQNPQQQWLLSDSTTSKAEPEPFIGSTQVWVFYNGIEGSSLGDAKWRLYRAETPLR